MRGACDIMTKSIAEASRQVINRHPSLLDALKLKVLNYAALANLIKKEVEEIIGREVKSEAIKMALLRYSDELSKHQETLEEEISSIIAKTVLELKNDVAVVTVRPYVLINRFGKIANELSTARFFQITQGTDTFTIVIDEHLLNKLIDVVGKENIIMTIRNQSALVLVSPKEIINTPGVIAYITSILAQNGVNITQIMSCYTDTIIIIDRKMALKAYSILENQIMLMRKRHK